MADAQKYQKLATEYAKLKAQIPVLKKAYLEEQAVCNDLKEKLKECEQSIRKYEQEVDSLTFRNQQLSTRVLFLQEELDQAETSKKKSKVAESNMQYQSRLEELEKSVKDYEGKFSHHQEVLDSTIQKDKAQIDKLQEEKAMLEIKCQSLEKETKSCRSRADIAENQLKTVQCHLQKQLEQANKIITDKLPFIDTKNRDLNGLNLPTHDRRHQLQARELVSQATNHTAELVQALSNFYTYSEQRSKIYPADGTHEPYSPVNIQYCKYLHENMTYLRPVEQSLKHFLSTLNEDSLTTLETATELQPFAVNFKKMVAYMNKLLPYQLSSLEEECAVSSCSASLESKNMDLHASLKHLTAVFNKLDTYVGLLAAQSGKTCSHPQKNHAHFFSHLCQALKDLNNAVREVSKHYNAKVSLEHQLPTATQRLKTTDECVVSSLISLVTCTGKFNAFLSGNLEFFSQSAGYRTRGSSIGIDSVTEGPRSNPAIVCYRQKAAGYLSSLASTAPDSVPHQVAVQNRQTLLSSAESKEGLSKQYSSRVSRHPPCKKHSGKRSVSHRAHGVTPCMCIGKFKKKHRVAPWPPV
uniref:Protein phosphatase 1 regulatory subunit 21 n=1 Tax=Magallana gigas TaxID=29159 RepID=K1PYE2_MAGGI